MAFSQKSDHGFMEIDSPCHNCKSQWHRTQGWPLLLQLIVPVAHRAPELCMMQSNKAVIEVYICSKTMMC